MNRMLAAISMVAVLTAGAVLSLSEIAIGQTLRGVTISGPSPWLDVRAYGAKGDGTTDDEAAIQAAINGCPDNGCTVYFPTNGNGSQYYIRSGLTITSKGMKLLGECGAINTATSCSHLVSDQNITMLTVGTGGTSAFDSGLVIQDIGFQDISTMSPGVAGAIRLLQTRDFVLTNVQCQDITHGYCFLFDGNNGNATYNFTQFGVVNSPFIINVKYPVQIVPEASEINFFGGNIDCNDPSDTDATIGMDLGKTRGSAGLKSGGEFGIFGTHIYNCNTGISMWNFSNLNYYGIMEQTSGGFHGTGILIDGDIAGKPTKNIIAGSIDELVKGIVLQGTAPPQYTRILANISNIDPAGAPIVASGTALSTAAIFTPVNYGAGSGGIGAAIGSQLPDLTIPEEDPPPSPVTGSRRIYVDKTLGAGDDITAKKSDGTTVDLESGLRSYQAPLPTITGTGSDQTVYTFSIPSIPKGKGVRAKVFWRCVPLNCGGVAAQTFKWQYGTSTLSYSAFTSSSTNLAYAQVSLFNDPNSQTNNTMVADAITLGTSLVATGVITSPNLDTSTARSLSFIFNSASSNQITPNGFVLEAIQ